jgi:hypothetical protein
MNRRYLVAVSFGCNWECICRWLCESANQVEPIICIGGQMAGLGGSTIIIDEPCHRQKFNPVAYLQINEGPQEGVNSLVNTLCLRVHLRMKRYYHPRFNINGSLECLSKLLYKLRVSHQNYTRWNPIQCLYLAYKNSARFSTFVSCLSMG